MFYLCTDTFDERHDLNFHAPNLSCANNQQFISCILLLCYLMFTLTTLFHLLFTCLAAKLIPADTKNNNSHETCDNLCGTETLILTQLWDTYMKVL